VAQAENGRTAVVRVLDGGPGLSGAQLRRVFDRDWRASNDLTKSVGGWGVGLAFARDLARDMGGDLSVAARPDGGCAFTLELPLGTEAEKEAT
jgi:signal transduction histidine kinase